METQWVVLYRKGFAMSIVEGVFPSAKLAVDWVEKNKAQTIYNDGSFFRRVSDYRWERESEFYVVQEVPSYNQ